jgi:class 3 adenylate cyclase
MTPAATTSGSARTTSTRLLAFMFTDLVDSSLLARQMGDRDYVEHVLEPHNAIFRRLLKQFPEAREVKHTGDGFMATFSRASEAAQMALEFHQELASAPWPAAPPTTRIGIHLGEAIGFSSSDGTPTDLAGDAANMTARVMSLAQPGQTLLTRAAIIARVSQSGGQKTVRGTGEFPVSYQSFEYRLG